MSLEHGDPLIHRHPDLPLANGDHAFGEMRVVLAQERKCHHEVVDVVEDQGIIGGVGVFGLEECHWVLAPVAERVQMVRGVVSVIEAVTIALVEGQ